MKKENGILGSKVILRCYGDKLAIGYVCDATPMVVLVASKERSERFLQGDRSIMPIGFHREDVFKYEPISGETCDWSKMTPWNESI